MSIHTRTFAKTDKMTTQTKLASRLAKAEPRIRAIYVSTYIPRECGIATYTKDLTNAINLLNPYFLADIIAIDDSKQINEEYSYPWEVKYKIDQQNLKSWIGAADYINQSGADVVVLQHEFGIYGGRDGEYAVPFLEAIDKPVIVTFHTILPKPPEGMRQMVERLAHRADAIIVMVNAAVDRLVETYNVNPKKIVVIPHGVPDIPFGPTEPAKKELGYAGSKIISGFGLISSGKGYEYAIEAMPEVLKKHPEAKLLVMGETHPVVLRNEGQKYRQKLESLIKKLGLGDSVELINRYLSLPEIVEYLEATDIYITPFLGMDQITSGTLSYAIGAGKVCISTPYLYAQEVVDEKRGVLVKMADSSDLANKIIDLFDHPKKSQTLAKNAYAYGRNMIWPNVALRHLDLFEIVMEEAHEQANVS